MELDAGTGGSKLKRSSPSKMKRPVCGGLFIEPAMKHHRNFTCFVPSTNDFCISNTVDFFPECCEIPALSPADHLTATLSKLKDPPQEVEANDLFKNISAEFATSRNKEHRAATVPLSKLKDPPQEVEANDLLKSISAEFTKSSRHRMASSAERQLTRSRIV